MNNLINPDGPEPDDATIGKAEHLRYLLLDWMERMQGLTNNQFYSDPIYNVNEGKGDIEEIRIRQSWRASDIWVGDSTIVFRKVSQVGSKFVRNEWLYLGRRSPGSLALKFQNSRPRRRSLSSQCRWCGLVIDGSVSTQGDLGVRNVGKTRSRFRMTRIFELCAALDLLSESPFWLILK
jgi:hypothetical protein